MIKQASVQEALKLAFPQFASKSKLIDYYVSFDFPQKQMKMVSWWQKVIQFIIEHQNKVYITYQELISYLSIYNLKPTPLQAIINYLANKEILGPQNQYEVRLASLEVNKQKSWFSTIISYVSSKPQAKEINYFKFSASERIYSRKIKEFKKQQIKKQLSNLFTDHSKSMNQFKLIQTLEVKVNLDKDSITELLKQLDKQQVIKRLQHGQKSFILYSHNAVDLHSKEWCEIEKMKYCLRQEIDKFEFMIGRQQEKAAKLKQKAKEQASNGNRKGGLATCKQILQKEKKIETISIRKNILENQITQLQYNQMNKTTLTLLQQAHTIYEQTMIDQSKLDQIAERNMELQNINKQTNQKLQTMASKEDYEEDVDEMLKALQKEMQRQPEKKTVKVHIGMDIESMSPEQQLKNERLNQKQKAMEIEFMEGKKIQSTDFN